MEIPSGQGRLILPVRVANENTGLASSCLLTDSAKQHFFPAMNLKVVLSYTTFALALSLGEYAKMADVILNAEKTLKALSKVDKKLKLTCLIASTKVTVFPVPGGPNTR